jgi:hypothetical protein
MDPLHKSFESTWVLATQSSNPYHKSVNDSVLNSPFSLTSTSFGGFQDQKDNSLIGVFYGTYKFGNCSISAGKQAGSTVSFGMAQTLGYAAGTGNHIADIAYGFVSFPQKSHLSLNYHTQQRYPEFKRLAGPV